MFREVARKNRALSREECIEILKTELRGVLSVQGDDGYPYALPINHYYDPETGHIFFHSGSAGYKLEALERCDKVSFCVYDEGYREEGHWALHIRSVIVFGRIRRIEDHERVLQLSRALSRKFTQDEAEIETEVLRSGFRTVGLELIPDHISGKLVKES